MTRGTLRTAGRLAALGLLAGFAPGIGPASAAAQEEIGAPPGFVFQASQRARIGVYLRPGCEVGAGATGDCPAPPVVASVVDGAPAARAGMQPGDTLLALDGVSLQTERG
ncbi:MAG TPA: PDZ domain-containing protein, partial [Alphaproteobacteria bacterium]|nr:PDZ domain-containing protein [Alphaproteobacteria bacterium]